MVLCDHACGGIIDVGESFLRYYILAIQTRYGCPRASVVLYAITRVRQQMSSTPQRSPSAATERSVWRRIGPDRADVLVACLVTIVVPSNCVR